MALQGFTADDAFKALLAASQRENRKLHDIAAELVERHVKASRHTGHGGGSTV